MLHRWRRVKRRQRRRGRDPSVYLFCASRPVTTCWHGHVLALGAGAGGDVCRLLPRCLQWMRSINPNAPGWSTCRRSRGFSRHWACGPRRRRRFCAAPRATTSFRLRSSAFGASSAEKHALAELSGTVESRAYQAGWRPEATVHHALSCVACAGGSSWPAWPRWPRRSRLPSGPACAAARLEHRHAADKGGGPPPRISRGSRLQPLAVPSTSTGTGIRPGEANHNRLDQSWFRGLRLRRYQREAFIERYKLLRRPRRPALPSTSSQHPTSTRLRSGAACLLVGLPGGSHTLKPGGQHRRFSSLWRAASWAERESARGTWLRAAAASRPSASFMFVKSLRKSSRCSSAIRCISRRRAVRLPALCRVGQPCRTGSAAASPRGTHR